MNLIEDAFASNFSEQNEQASVLHWKGFTTSRKCNLCSTGKLWLSLPSAQQVNNLPRANTLIVLKHITYSTKIHYLTWRTCTVASREFFLRFHFPFLFPSFPRSQLAHSTGQWRMMASFSMPFSSLVRTCTCMGGAQMNLEPWKQPHPTYLSTFNEDM